MEVVLVVAVGMVRVVCSGKGFPHPFLLLLLLRLGGVRVECRA
jgi:hypothetical protein